MNLKAIIIIFAIIFVNFAGGCADKPSTQNSGPDQNINYGLVPPYFTLLSSPDTIKPEEPARPVIRDEGEEINKILSEAVMISQELDSRILSYEKEGKDVQRPKSLLEEYNTLIASAKTYRELADQHHDGCTDPECQKIQKELYLHQSRESLKRSNSVLSDIFNEMKIMLPGHVILGEGCTLSGTGTGRVLLAGDDLSANLSIRNGIFYIIGLPHSSGSPVSIVGKYEFENSDNPQDRVSYYKILDAKVDISAQRSAFIVEANEISLIIKGNGTIDFFGNGTYSVTCPDGSFDGMRWEVPAVRRTINSPSAYTGSK
jgi:hypothetical protein